MKLTGSAILIECLKREGVDTLFGYPGGVVLGLYDHLHQQNDIRHVLCRHEQGAIHMAEGYARSTGRVGTALVTSGPGATNTITGLWDALMDSVPLVVFTGQVPTSLIGNDAFQEADIIGTSLSCTKYNFLVKRVEDLARTIKEAYYIAASGRPGPVLIDLPKDVTFATTEFSYPDSVYLRSYNPTIRGNKGQIKKAATAIRRARRPVLYTGGGVVSSGASAELHRLAELIRCPVTNTLMGLGGFRGSDPAFLGMLGMHGTYRANMAMYESDLVIAVGVRFDDRVTGKVDEFIPNAKIIHVDIDPTSIRKNIQVDIPIVGDVKHVLADLIGILEEADGPLFDTAERETWEARIAEMEAAHPLGYKTSSQSIKPQQVIEKIYELTQGNAIVSTDVGQHQMFTAQYYKFENGRDWLTSGGLGTMGYGFPAALGAQAAHPDRLVITVSGDGSIQMNIQELATAVINELPVKVIILNNHYLGMVRQWQQLFYNEHYSHSYLAATPDFVKLAEAYGAVGLRATRPEELEAVLLEAFRVKKPVFVDVQVDPSENVYPMVPAGKANFQMVFSDPDDAHPVPVPDRIPGQAPAKKSPARASAEASAATPADFRD
ncbi:MAG: biosynthetic-type acetolactate synthase large subunit [Nitrospirota bacterium]|nr:biosynthetic-type acetolactate synthase large subunit [Nitrospirota bacterium]